MTTIRLNDILTRDNDLTVSGAILYDILKKRVEESEKVVIDMENATSLPSIFLNVSFGRLMDEFGRDSLLGLISFVKITRSQAERLKKYIQSYQC